MQSNTSVRSIGSPENDDVCNKAMEIYNYLRESASESSSRPMFIKQTTSVTAYSGISKEIDCSRVAIAKYETKTSVLDGDEGGIGSIREVRFKAGLADAKRLKFN